MKSSEKIESLIRNVSDTARWVAVDRAVESERPDALFHDPFARRLAGEHGEQIANAKPFGHNSSWPIITRTYLIDEMIRTQIQQGADTVINLAAGLDSRPYRMDLPSGLRWFEVDLPEILVHKEEVLHNEKPVCSLELIRLDLSNVSARRELFERLGRETRKALVITEGLLIYLSADEVALLAQDLAAVPSFHSWILDMVSPALLRRLKKRFASNLNQAELFKFAPEEGPGFFAKFGWTSLEADSLIKIAVGLHRLPFYMIPFSWFPDMHGKQPSRPWGGVCLFTRAN